MKIIMNKFKKNFSIGKLSKTLILVMIICVMLSSVISSCFNIFSVSRMLDESSSRYLTLLVNQQSTKIDGELRDVEEAVNSINYKIKQRFNQEKFNLDKSIYINNFEKEIELLIMEEAFLLSLKKFHYCLNSLMNMQN